MYETLFRFQDATGSYMGTEPHHRPWAQVLFINYTTNVTTTATTSTIIITTFTTITTNTITITIRGFLSPPHCQEVLRLSVQSPSTVLT